MQKNCSNCGYTFQITDADIQFYKDVSTTIGQHVFNLPPPSHCPDCRQQRRMSFRNERKLHKRTCDSCKKQIIAIYDSSVLHPVYCHECWWSDQWSPLDYAKAFDESRPFFEQLSELLNAVPAIASIVNKSENCEFNQDIRESKNCYLCVRCGRSTDLFYCYRAMDSKDCVDCNRVFESELLYECIECHRCFNCIHLLKCDDCTDSSFLFDCKNCKHCFLSSNLRNKEYYYLNKKYSKEEYMQKVRQALSGYSQHSEMNGQFQMVVQEAAHLSNRLINCDNCTGDDLANCKNCFECFDLEKCEDCKYVWDAHSQKTAMDVYTGGEAEQTYECSSVGTHSHYNIKMSVTIKSGTNVEYCLSCFNSKDIFGCVGLKGNQYCILNKQYTREEYVKLISKIIPQMIQRKEYGEFFPASISPYPYNESVAMEFFPLTKNEVTSKGWKWKETTDEIGKVEKIIPASKLPDMIEDIPDDVLNWAIECNKTKRPFLVQKRELTFYRKMCLPIPRLHPDERHQNRMILRNPRKLWRRKCDKCENEIETTYSSERSEKVFCEDCYLKEVY